MMLSAKQLQLACTVYDQMVYDKLFLFGVAVEQRKSFGCK